MYFAANYATYSPMYFGFVLVYNKDIAEDYHLEIPYEKIFAEEEPELAQYYGIRQAPTLILAEGEGFRFRSQLSAYSQ